MRLRIIALLGYDPPTMAWGLRTCPANAQRGRYRHGIARAADELDAKPLSVHAACSAVTKTEGVIMKTVRAHTLAASLIVALAGTCLAAVDLDRTVLPIHEP